MKKYSVVILSSALIALAGCTQAPEEPSNTHIIPRFGFSIDYPQDWLAETQGTITHISELEEDHAHAFLDDQYRPAGYAITLDHRTVSFLQSIGLKENSTLDDLLVFNAGNFDWQESTVEETEIFGVPALRAKNVDEDGSARDIFMGFVEDEVFLFGLGSPSEDARDEFSSEWEEMLDSIQPVEDQVNNFPSSR